MFFVFFYPEDQIFVFAQICIGRKVLKQRFVNRWSIIALSKSVAAPYTLNANE